MVAGDGHDGQDDGPDAVRPEGLCEAEDHRVADQQQHAAHGDVPCDGDGGDADCDGDGAGARKVSGSRTAIGLGYGMTPLCSA